MKKLLLTYSALCLLAACGSGGGSEAGNPGDSVLRPIIGSVSSGGSGALNRSLGKSTLGELCGADNVQAIDSTGSTSSSGLEDDCSFNLELAPGKSYLIGFIRDEQFIASLIVQNAAGALESSIVFLAAGADPVDLGEITIVGNRATPSAQPAQQNDRDGDGDDDFEDNDDDDDGVVDGDESDCDLDGFINDDDDDDSECESEDEESDNTAIVREVSPRNNEGISTGEPVGLDEDIEVRFGCNVDPASITAVTFAISADGDVVDCEFEIDNDEVHCLHEDDPFLANTTYTATLDGVQCENSDPVTSTEWSWKTELED